MDVSTRWNSSFLAWERLLLLKDAIDIVLATLSISTTSEARKDAKRLKKIQLTDDEWDLMRDLVNILGHFFEVTEELGGSKYATISYMFPSILGLIEKLDISADYWEESNNVVDFETTDLVFDDNVRFVDAQEEEEDGPKGRKVQINTPIDVTDMKPKIKNALYHALLHYWDLSDGEVFLAYLLDPRCKKLRFATSDQQRQAETALQEKYNNIKSIRQSSLPVGNDPLNFHEEISTENNWRGQRQIYQKTFFKSIFNQETSDNSTDELSHYLSLPEIYYKSNPFHWWDSNKASFPILGELARQYLAIPATSTLSE